MSNMKDTGIAWIGEIPCSWPLLRFKDKYRNVKEVVGDRVDEFERLALTLNGVIKRQKDDSEGLQPEKFDGYQILKTGDFVFKMIDLQNISTSRVGLSSYTGLVSPAYLRFEPRTSENSKFVYYFLMSLYYNEVYNNLGGNGVRSALNSTDMGNFLMPYPAQEIQEKIVTLLDAKIAKIGELIANQEQQIIKLKEYKSSLITEVVTKGLNSNAQMKDSEVDWLGEIPTTWKVVMLGSLFYEHQKKNTDLLCNNLLSLSYGKIKRKDINTSDGLLPASFDGYNIIEPNDIVLRLTDLQNDQKSLRVGISEDTGIVTSAYVTLRLRNKNQVSKFYYYLLHSFDIQKGFYGMGAGVRQGLNFDGVRKILLANPPLEEQEEIVAYLDKKCAQIDELIAIKEEKIKRLIDYKKSLIYEYVTGKKEVV